MKFFNERISINNFPAKNLIHEDILIKFKYAKVKGKSVKFDWQRVGLEHVVEEIKSCRQLLGSDCKYTTNDVEDLHNEIYGKPTLKMFAVWSNPDKRGNGYATKILADLIGHAREKGIQYVRIGADNGAPDEFKTDEQIAVKGLVRKLHVASEVPAEHLMGNWFRIH